MTKREIKLAIKAARSAANFFNNDYGYACIIFQDKLNKVGVRAKGAREVRSYFESMFKPKGGNIWWRNPVIYGDAMPRAIALDLLAEMLEDELKQRRKK